MGDGRIKSRKNVTVVDLDGTLINGNTLHIYAVEAIKFHMRRGGVKAATGIIRAIIQRFCGMISHSNMKGRVLALGGDSKQLLSLFARKVSRRINPNVKSFLAEREKHGDYILLATAAPEFYVRAIWNGNYVATDYSPGETMLECRGEEKLSAINRWMAEHDAELANVLSDHYDDAPLFRAEKTGRNILVNPDKATLRFFRELEPTEFLLVEQLSDGVVPD